MNIVQPYAKIILINGLPTNLHLSRRSHAGIRALRHIEWCGRISHRSEEAQSDTSWERFIKAVVLDHGDWSIVEHATASVDMLVDRGVCYDPQTEVLTRSGWKHFVDLEYSDSLACLSDEGEFQWHLPQAIEKFKYSGDLLHFHSSSIDLLVTPNHNMWVYDYQKRSVSERVWKFLPASELKNSRYKFNKTCSSWQGCDCPITIPAHRTKRYKFPSVTLTDSQALDLFELLGLWITDGSYSKGYDSGESVLITQTKASVRKRIEYLCRNLGFRCTYHDGSYRIDNGRLSDFVKGLFGDGPKTFTASVPDVIKNSSTDRLKRFLAGALLGDGNTHQINSHRVIYTSSSKFAGDLQELFLKVGVSANARTIQPRVRGSILGGKPVGECKVSYVVSVHERKRSVHMLSRKSAKAFGSATPFDGTVYCATVPWHRLYVRRNGKAVWCGNTHELVRHRLFSFTQESTRFVNYEKKMPPAFINPFPEDDFNILKEQAWGEAVLACEKGYKDLIARGVTPQIARSVFPNALASRIVVTGNLRNWRHLLLMRTTKETHPQFRQVSIPLLKEFQAKIPLLFDDIEPEARQIDNMRKPH